MLRVPKREPKGYDLSNVTDSFMSSSQHTPESAPRVTQTTLGKYCRPIDYPSNDVLTEWKVPPINSKVLDKYTKDQKAWWVVKPGEDAEFLNEVYQKYNVNVQTKTDPRYKFNPRIFQRSFKYEIDTMEEARQKLIARKLCEDRCRDLAIQSKAKPEVDLTPEQEQRKALCKHLIKTSVDSSEYRANYKRWRTVPRLFTPSLRNACTRRKALQHFRQPFKHDGCIWYHTNYPGPDIPFKPERFM